MLMAIMEDIRVILVKLAVTLLSHSARLKHFMRDKQ